MQAIHLPGVSDRDRDHLLQLLTQKIGEPLDRGHVRESIRNLYATGRFADIQAEASPAGNGVDLTFSTSASFFVGAIVVEGNPNRPTTNQIVNASKLQLGELYTRDKLERALNNVRQLMQENGYYRARVTAESTSNVATQQVDILFHVTPSEQAHVGEVKVTGTSSLSAAEVQAICPHEPRGQGQRRAGERLAAAAAQEVSKAEPRDGAGLHCRTAVPSASNAVDFTFQIEPGPVVVIYAEGYHVSRGVMKKEIPVYEENAVDDDLLNEGKRNLLDYLQTRGHFDASVEIEKKADEKTMQVIYHINPGPIAQAGDGRDYAATRTSWIRKLCCHAWRFSPQRAF